MKYTYKHTLHACYLGYITQAINNNLAPILFVIFQDKFQISFEMIGRLIFINFGTQIVADILSVKYIDKIGYRRAAILAHICSATGLLGLGIFPLIFPNPYLGLTVAVMIYAMGGGIIEVLVSPIVESLPGDAKASAMSLLHSFYCWGQMGVVLVTTLILKLFGTDIWFILPMAWSIVPIYNLFQFRKVPLMPTVAEEEKTPIRQLFSSRAFLIAMLLMICAGACELTMSQWSSLFAQKGLNVPKVMGDLLGPCLFAILMGIGRTIYGIYGTRIKLKTALLISGLLCIICYLITVFSPWPVLSLFGCALSGLSVSLMWPGTFSLTASDYPRGGAAMFGILAICGDIGCSIGPWMAGIISDMYGGLKFGILTGVIFPILLFIGVTMMKPEV